MSFRYDVDLFCFQNSIVQKVRSRKVGYNGTSGKIFGLLCNKTSGR